MQIKYSQAIENIVECIQLKLVPMLGGSPAIGKSSIVQQIADTYNLKMIDLRLSQSEPTDLSGFPTIYQSRDKAGYVPMDTFPVEGDKLPEGYAGWLLFLDEFNSAPRSVQAASYKLVLDRMVGNHKLHKNVAVVCAGNLESDGAIVEELSTALQSRMIHFEMVVDSKEWLDWAASQNFDHRITSYVRFKPGNLYNFSPDHTDKTYSSPRTWEFANRYVSKRDTLDHSNLPFLAGTLSEGVAREFVGFCGIYKDLPTIGQIEANPATLAIPTEPSVLFALTGSISHHATMDNIDSLMIYVPRLPIEFQIVCLREMVRRNKELKGAACVQAWMVKNANELF